MVGNIHRPQSVGGKDREALREDDHEEDSEDHQSVPQADVEETRLRERDARRDGNGNGRDRSVGEEDVDPQGGNAIARSPTRTHTPTVEDTDQNAKLQFLNDLLQLSPEKQNAAWRILGLVRPPNVTAKAPAAAAAPKKLFTVATEKSGDLFSNKPVESLPQHVSLLSHGFHLPLTACTSPVVKYMRDNPGETRYKRLHNFKGAKLNLLDTSSFPPETDMQPEEWRDAWRNFDQVLADICDDTIRARFAEHHAWLCDVDDFSSLFPAILRFDIETRKSYFTGSNTSFFVGSGAYKDRLRDTRLAIQEEHARAQHEPHCRSPAASPSHLRYNPYPSYSDRHEPSGRGDPAPTRFPFHPDRSSDTVAATCLICSLGGHRANVCGKTSLPNGEPTYSVWYDNKLLASHSRNEACVSWNVVGRTPCQSTKCPGLHSHFCSFCGSSDHPAASQQCL